MSIYFFVYRDRWNRVVLVQLQVWKKASNSMIEKVENDTLMKAAVIHSVAWKASHNAICSEEFISIHTPERQKEYLSKIIDDGAVIYMLSNDNKPVGIVSVHGDLIENLYVLPEEQNHGYGTQLIKYAIEKCSRNPKLWILENNFSARRLYERIGFCVTGEKHQLSDTISEIEMIFAK